LSFLIDRFKYRDGGYTRIRPIGYRDGDKAPMAIIELLRDDSKMTYDDYFVEEKRVKLASE
jgi:hypothetical protein